VCSEGPDVSGPVDCELCRRVSSEGSEEGVLRAPGFGMFCNSDDGIAA
jgi:hypothetical protein